MPLSFQKKDAVTPPLASEFSEVTVTVAFPRASAKLEPVGPGRAVRRVRTFRRASRLLQSG